MCLSESASGVSSQFPAGGRHVVTLSVGRGYYFSEMFKEWLRLSSVLPALLCLVLTCRLHNIRAFQLVSPLSFAPM